MDNGGINLVSPELHNDPLSHRHMCIPFQRNAVGIGFSDVQRQNHFDKQCLAIAMEQGSIRHIHKNTKKPPMNDKGHSEKLRPVIKYLRKRGLITIPSTPVHVYTKQGV